MFGRMAVVSGAGGREGATDRAPGSTADKTHVSCQVCVCLWRVTHLFEGESNDEGGRIQRLAHACECDVDIEAAHGDGLFTEELVRLARALRKGALRARAEQRVELAQEHALGAVGREGGH